MYEQHLEQLAREIGVVIRYDAQPYWAQYDPMFGEVKIQEIKNWGFVPTPDDIAGTREDLEYSAQTCYFIGLHELGHAALRHGSRAMYDILTTEAEAWQWAIENAAEPMDGTAAAFALAALEAYWNVFPGESSLWAQTVEVLREWAR